MRICFVSLQYPPMTLGGAGVYASNLCIELAKLGHEVHVLSPSSRRGTTRISGNLTVHGIHILNRHLLKTFSFWLKIRGLFKTLQQEVDFDLLHTNVTSGLGLTPHLVRIPRVVTIHHLANTVFQATRDTAQRTFKDIEGETGLLSKIEKRFLDFDKVEIDRADRVITVSKFVKKSIVSTYAVPESKIETIYSGVSSKEYLYDGDEPEVREAYRLDDEPIVLYVGRLEKRKNLECLIKAFKLVVEKTKCNLVIVGDGDPSSLREMALSMGIGKHVVFTGFVENDTLKHLYNACDVFVLPSHMEGFGLTLLEAMASARPVVASNVGGIPELVKKGENGMLVDPNDPRDLATALTFLLLNPDIARKIGLQNREYVSRNFSWEKTAENTSTLYKRIMEINNKKEGTVS